MNMGRANKTLLSISLIVLLLPVYNVANAQLWGAQNSTTGVDLHNINFFDDNIGWAFGDSTIGLSFQRPVILKTTNQGVTWSTQDLGTDSIKIL